MRLSLRNYLVVPFLLLFLGAAALIGWAGYRSGKESLEQFQRQVAAEVGVRVAAHLDRFFSAAANVALANADAMRAGLLDPARPVGLQQAFVGQMRHLPFLTFVSFGRADGQYVGATRLLDTNEVRLMAALKDEGMTIDTFEVEANNTRGRRVSRGPDFDARSRGWFRQAAESGRPGWYPVYKYKPYDSLGIGISVPVLNTEGRLLGITTGDVALVQVARYLQAQAIGRSGVAFVAEPDGKLIASSLPEPLFRLEGENVVRIAVAEHRDPRIRAAGEWMQVAAATSGQHFLTIGGERVLLDLRQYRDVHGLNLQIGILLPERDFAASFENNLQLLGWLTVAIAALGAVVGVILAGWLARPLAEINRRAERIAGGDWAADVKGESRVQEYAELSRSFNTMAASLRDAFAGLEARVAERTRALEAANGELERVAMLDGLTHIANRRRFDAALQQEWRRCLRERQPMSLLMIDVDDFKAYNDEYGHQAGDEVLVRIAAACQGVMKRSTDTAARYGGEEFAIILANTDAAGALRIAEAVATAVRDAGMPHRRATAAEVVTVSVGVATMVPDNRQGPEILVSHADQALYAAKRAGRNRIEVAR